MSKSVAERLWSKVERQWPSPVRIRGGQWIEDQK
jgi:hypothetical protein